jgi:tetratricopeptide (TPR) repeat protein
MEALAQAITTLPPDAVDRQRLLECLGNAERNVRALKHKEASKWVMQVGAQLHKLGGDALKIAERVFQHAVFLAKQLDDGAPDFIAVEFESNNTELGDAYTWLGATEAALGKTAEAENHYKAAARAVEERGVVELGDKLLHQAIFFRNRKMREKYDAVVKKWEQCILRAGEEGSDKEGDVALLHATCALLQEKSMGVSHLVGGAGGGGPDSKENLQAIKGQTLAAELRAGRLAETAMRLEAHPLKPQGATPLADVFELAASTYDRVRNRRLAIVNISKSLASVAGAKRFAGLAPMGEMRRMVEGDDTVVWKPWLVGKWLGPGEGGEDLPKTLPETASDEEKEALKKRLEKEELDKVKLPQVMFATINHVFKVGDSWKMRGGKPGLPPVMEHAEAVGKQCYVLGQQMFAAEAWKECQRPLRAAAALLMHQPFQQGAACHYLACAYFHENNRAHGGKNEKLMQFAAGAFQSAAAARLSLGPKHPKAIKEAVGSLLFLARVLSELKDFGNAERVHVQALEIARDALGDGAEETKQCLQSLMGLKQRMKQAET